MLLWYSHKRRRFQNPAPDFLWRQAHVFGAKGNVFVHRLFKELVLRILKHQANLEPNASGEGLIAPNIPPVK